MTTFLPVEAVTRQVHSTAYSLLAVTMTDDMRNATTSGLSGGGSLAGAKRDFKSRAEDLDDVRPAKRMSPSPPPGQQSPGVGEDGDANRELFDSRPTGDTAPSAASSLSAVPSSLATDVPTENRGAPSGAHSCHMGTRVEDKFHEHAGDRAEQDVRQAMCSNASPTKSQAIVSPLLPGGTASGARPQGSPSRIAPGVSRVHLSESLPLIHTSPTLTNSDTSATRASRAQQPMELASHASLLWENLPSPGPASSAGFTFSAACAFSPPLHRRDVLQPSPQQNSGLNGVVHANSLPPSTSGFKRGSGRDSTEGQGHLDAGDVTMTVWPGVGSSSGFGRIYKDTKVSSEGDNNPGGPPNTEEQPLVGDFCASNSWDGGCASNAAPGCGGGLSAAPACGNCANARTVGTRAGANEARGSGVAADDGASSRTPCYCKSGDTGRRLSPLLMRSRTFDGQIGESWRDRRSSDRFHASGEAGAMASGECREAIGTNVGTHASGVSDGPGDVGRSSFPQGMGHGGGRNGSQNSTVGGVGGLGEEKDTDLESSLASGVGHLEASLAGGSYSHSNSSGSTNSYNSGIMGDGFDHLLLPGDFQDIHACMRTLQAGSPTLGGCHSDPTHLPFDGASSNGSGHPEGLHPAPDGGDHGGPCRGNHLGVASSDPPVPDGSSAEPLNAHHDSSSLFPFEFSSNGTVSHNNASPATSLMEFVAEEPEALDAPSPPMSSFELPPPSNPASVKTIVNHTSEAATSPALGMGAGENPSKAHAKSDPDPDPDPDTSTNRGVALPEASGRVCAQNSAVTADSVVRTTGSTTKPSQGSRLPETKKPQPPASTARREPRFGDDYQSYIPPLGSWRYDKLQREPPTRLWEPGVVHDSIMQCVLPKPRLDGPGTDDLEQSLLSTYLQERIRRNVYTAKDAASNLGKRSFVPGRSSASATTGSPCAANRSVLSSPARTGFPSGSVRAEGRGKGVASPGAKSMRLDENGLSPRRKGGDDSIRDSRKPADVNDDDDNAELARITTVISEGPGARWRSDWSDEDRAAFRKGIYEYRRNFARIWEHYLPHRTYGEIVSFFYRHWKQGPEFKNWKKVDYLIGRPVVKCPWNSANSFIDTKTNFRRGYVASREPEKGDSWFVVTFPRDGDHPPVMEEVELPELEMMLVDVTGDDGYGDRGLRFPSVPQRSRSLHTRGTCGSPGCGIPDTVEGPTGGGSPATSRSSLRVSRFISGVARRRGSHDVKSCRRPNSVEDTTLGAKRKEASSDEEEDEDYKRSRDALVLSRRGRVSRVSSGLHSSVDIPGSRKRRALHGDVDESSDDSPDTEEAEASGPASNESTFEVESDSTASVSHTAGSMSPSRPGTSPVLSTRRSPPSTPSGSVAIDSSPPPPTQLFTDGPSSSPSPPQAPSSLFNFGWSGVDREGSQLADPCGVSFISPNHGAGDTETLPGL